jgi:DNA-binding NarL/FixJ family response regulator
MTTKSISKPIRVLVADDHALFRAGLRGLLEAVPDTTVVGEAATGDQAVTMADRLRPDVVLMDIAMPGGNGIDATQRIVRAHPEVGVLMLSMLEDDESLFAAMRAGARGYVLKGVSPGRILRAIRVVHSGEAIFSPAIATRLLDFFAAPKAPPAFPQLTQREREILAAIARGQTNQEIAGALSLSLKTVQNHVSNIYAKLRVADRTRAAIRAREAGLT